MIPESFIACFALVFLSVNIQSSQAAIDWVSLLPQLIPSVTTLIFGAVLTGLGYLLKSEQEHTREIEQQLSERKRDVYMKLIDGLDAMLHGDEEKRKTNIVRLNEVSKELLFYGSDDVINTYRTYLKVATSQEDVSEDDFKKTLGNILLAIR